MIELHLPWLQLAAVIPLLGAVVVGRLRSAEKAQRVSLVFCGAALACTVGAWQDFQWLEASLAHDRWDALRSILGRDVFSLDELARATGAAPSTLRGLVDSGRLPLVSGTSFVRGRDAVAIGRWLLDAGYGRRPDHVRGAASGYLDAVQLLLAAQDGPGLEVRKVVDAARAVSPPIET